VSYPAALQQVQALQPAQALLCEHDPS